MEFCRPRLLVNFFVLLSHIPYKDLMSCPWLVYLKFSLGYGYPHPLFANMIMDYVKRFVRVLVLLVINTGCSKKLLKLGNTTLLISSSTILNAS